jgi:hypothetical protein
MMIKNQIFKFRETARRSEISVRECGGQKKHLLRKRRLRAKTNMAPLR